jgi:hypothetical protein
MEENPVATSSSVGATLGEESSACGASKPPSCKSPRKVVKKCESASFHLDGAIYTIGKFLLISKLASH